MTSLNSECLFARYYKTKSPFHSFRPAVDTIDARSLGFALKLMESGVRFEVLWNDADMFKVRVSAWNGLFGGSASIYLAIGDLAESAEKLKGFPRHPSDKRALDFGAFGPQVAGGAATMNFYCGDSTGHASIAVTIESDHRGKIPAQSVQLVAAVEPAPLDTFIADLRRLEAAQRGTAFLRTSG
jgi:hypothetical protein